LVVAAHDDKDPWRDWSGCLNRYNVKRDLDQQGGSHQLGLVLICDAVKQKSGAQVKVVIAIKAIW